MKLFTLSFSLCHVLTRYIVEIFHLELTKLSQECPLEVILYDRGWSEYAIKSDPFKRLYKMSNE